MPRIRKNKPEDKVETKFSLADLGAFCQSTLGCNYNVDDRYDAFLYAVRDSSYARPPREEHPMTEVSIRGSSPYRVSSRDYATYLLEQLERGDAIVRDISVDPSYGNPYATEVTIKLKVRAI